MFKVAKLNAIAAIGLARLPDSDYVISDELDAADAIVLRSADLHARTLPASVLAVARAGAGTNNIPVAALSERGVPVFNAPGANANAVKELVLAGMLMAARHIDEALAFVAGLDAGDGLDARVEAEKKRFNGSELEGKTLGVIGLGAIGVRVANAAYALGMRVIGYDPHMTVDGAWQLDASVQRAASPQELYAASDYVSFHVPLVDATRGLFAHESLSVAKPGLVVLNFARNGIVDVDAVLAGIDGGRIGAYVTDFPTAALLGHPRVLALPHLGASTGEAEENCAVMVIEQLRQYLEHGDIRHSVNFPNTRMPRSGSARLCIANRNRPNMIGQLSQALGEAGANIAQMRNASRGELAYNLIDLDAPAPAGLEAAIAAIEGILSVRLLANAD
ncbi:MAG: phosphoglycerate dehydrogenase [Xanthomonadales bacterium]|nr:phosphoglycerate dehydrogenase [Xanthomonadales bacterium]